MKTFYLISIVSNEQRLSRRLTINGDILSLSSLTVGLSPLNQDSLGSGNVSRVTLPGPQDRVLEGSTVGEGDVPGASKRSLVDGVEVAGSILLRLSTRKELKGKRG